MKIHKTKINFVKHLIYRSTSLSSCGHVDKIWSLKFSRSNLQESSSQTASFLSRKQNEHRGLADKPCVQRQVVQKLLRAAFPQKATYLYLNFQARGLQRQRSTQSGWVAPGLVGFLTLSTPIWFHHIIEFPQIYRLI